MHEHRSLTDKQVQEFINKLDKGMDGTLFVPVDKYGDKAYKTTHFGLSKLLLFAFDLTLKEDKNNNTEFLQISFDNFYDYVENAKNILRNMRYIEGDKVIINHQDMIIYENPQNYSVIELDNIFPLNEEQFQRNYLVRGIHLTETGFLTQKSLIKRQEIDSSLIPREKEAFYGEGAKKSLGLIPNNKNKKQISKKILPNK